MDRERDAQLVIGPDGTVLAAVGNLAPGLVDVRLDDCHGLSPEIRKAGNMLVEELRLSGNRVVTRTMALDTGGRTVELVAIEALAIRRTATDVRALLSSKLNVISTQAAAVDVSLTVVTAGDVPAVVHLDSDKVAWAVTTLVGNALRYLRLGSRRARPGRSTCGRASIQQAPRSSSKYKTMARVFRPIPSRGCSGMTA